ncbi:MAG: dTDP-glucose 4 6-dehydratase [Limisphaerales bacterium]|nr:MAG: dTDP-glucose 4 6-dehydratase [Limisphaerales bacterium]KAG0510391.1 MAG: dTDP-glucose 4 6-dehydratase [Limisphaerales bacterium]TXT51578.1 MAG: dTDP-glucose 4 6-dehydratase [Limisphaerales bacterium]
MKTYVILGGGGSFGIHTALYLLANADARKVICVGRNPEKPEPFSLNVGKGDPRYAYHQIHLVHEQDRLFELFDAEKPEVIISYAAQGEGAVSWKKSWRFFETNCVALTKMSEDLMKRDYMERFIQIGTSELYGSVNFAAKETTPLQPTSPYAASKAAFDLYLMSVANVLKFRMNIIRPSNAYCPGQLLHRVIPRAVLCGLTGQKLPLQGGGRAEKSYIHARDLARAILLVSEKAPLGKVYNAGPPLPISIRNLVAKVAEGFPMPFEQLCEVVPDRLGQDSRYWLDSSAIKQDVGWEAQISIEEGVQEMIAWGRQYLDQIRDVPTGYVLRT